MYKQWMHIRSHNLEMFKFYVIIIFVFSKFKWLRMLWETKWLTNSQRPLGMSQFNVLSVWGVVKATFWLANLRNGHLLSLLSHGCSVSAVCSPFLWSPKSPANTPSPDISVRGQDFSVWGNLQQNSGLRVHMVENFKVKSFIKVCLEGWWDQCAKGQNLDKSFACLTD